MGSQKSIIIENAQQFAANGKIDKAIAEWKKLLAETPQDGNIYNNIADLYLRVNDKASAIDACLKAAMVYREAGFELKGVAVLKKVLKVDPNRVDIYEMLADINADRGLTGAAVAEYQQTAKLYMKNGNFKGAIAVYQKLGKFTPQDPEIPLTIARLYQKQERFREAVFSYEQAEAIYESKGMVSEAHQIIEEIIKIDPSYLKQLVAKEASIASIGGMTIERDITIAPPKNGSESSKFLIDESNDTYLSNKPFSKEEDAVFSDEMDIFKDLIPDDALPPIGSSSVGSSSDNARPMVQDVLEGSFEMPNRLNGLPPLLDDVKGNPFLEAKRENNVENTSQPVFFSESEDLDIDLRDAVAASVAKRAAPDVASAIPEEVIQNDKKQQYLETCYHLGIAQKEIGNFAKAIREFEQALDGTGRFQEVLSLLAGCYAEQGNLAQAAGVLKNGVNDPRCKEGFRFAILYDLAGIYDQLGEKEKSFPIYKEIYRVDPNFRDVAGKIKEIPYRKSASESIRVKEQIPLPTEGMPTKENAAPVVKEKRRISYV